jgi:hypothetical protein
MALTAIIIKPKQEIIKRISKLLFTKVVQSVHLFSLRSRSVSRSSAVPLLTVRWNCSLTLELITIALIITRRAHIFTIHQFFN